MAYETPNMGLTGWDLGSDPYNHTELLANWVAVDEHNHTPGKGAPLPPEAIPPIKVDQLGPCSVNTNQLCDKAVTQVKLRKPAVGVNEIFADAIRQNHIAEGQVGNAQLEERAVGRNELKVVGDPQGAAVTPDHITDAAVRNRHIQPGSIDRSKLGARVIDTPQLEPGAVTNSILATDSVGSEKIADAQVHRWHLAKDAFPTLPDADVCPSVGVRLIADQPISQGIEPIRWTSEHYDTDNMFDLNGDQTTVTIRTSGMYVINASVAWRDTSPAAALSIHLVYSRSYIGAVGPVVWDSFDYYGASQTQQITRVYPLHADGTISLEARNIGTPQSAQDWAVRAGGATGLSLCWLAEYPPGL